MTADHKVLSENCESRNNHRYAVVVQHLATQWIQAKPCKTKTSQETQRSLQKFLEPNRKPKVIYTDNSMDFGKACEDLSWNHFSSTPHRSETNGTAERALRRGKEGTSAVLLQSLEIDTAASIPASVSTGLSESDGQLLRDVVGSFFWLLPWRTCVRPAAVDGARFRLTRSTGAEMPSLSRSPLWRR